MTRFAVPDWDGAVATLRDADTITIACHVNPDGDALGSLLAVSLAFRKVGKTTYPSWGTEPLVMPPNLGWLPGVDHLVGPKEVPTGHTMLALDCGARDRLGALEPLSHSSPCVINIDHHPKNDEFGRYNIVVTTASSTAELVHALLEDLAISLDRDIATCLYTGLVTDTGRFQYASTTPDTLRLAADLLAYGVPATEIAQDVFESSPFGYLKLVGRVLDRAELLEEERFVYSFVTRRDLDETGVGLEDTDSLIDLVRSTSAADVAALFKEQGDGAWRASLRSKGPVSVGAIARAEGGGGHELAAGFTATDLDSAVSSIAEAIASQRAEGAAAR